MVVQSDAGAIPATSTTISDVRADSDGGELGSTAVLKRGRDPVSYTVIVQKL